MKRLAVSKTFLRFAARQTLVQSQRLDVEFEKQRICGFSQVQHCYAHALHMFRINTNNPTAFDYSRPLRLSNTNFRIECCCHIENRTLKGSKGFDAT